MSTYATSSFTANGRSYQPPARPVAVILLDGSADEYLTQAIAHDRMPNVAALARTGYRGFARGALPSFTNVNNCAIVTGLPPAGTGIAGNYILDPKTGQEVMTNSSQYLKPETLLAAAANAGRKVAMVTAKDKLRELLAKNLKGISFSAEKVKQATLAINGIENVEDLAGPQPSVYSGEASIYVLRAGVALIESGQADFCYLTTTDYMQHKYAPAAPEALDFYGEIDNYVGRLLKLGTVVGITADHGMNAKCDADGNPRVIYLETELTETFGEGIRVICPITDPYVVHHGALGSAVTVYVADEGKRAEIQKWLLAKPGIVEV